MATAEAVVDRFEPDRTPTRLCNRLTYQWTYISTAYSCQQFTRTPLNVSKHLNVVVPVQDPLVRTVPHSL